MPVGPVGIELDKENLGRFNNISMPQKNLDDLHVSFILVEWIYLLLYYYFNDMRSKLIEEMKLTW